MPSPRSCLPKLTPAQLHERDIRRAAQLGMDISHLQPDERCKYPSKFCCNKRARKSTGKLHRFCEEHRMRAQINQKRWTDVRRRQEQAHEAILARSMSSLGIPKETLLLKNEPSSPTHIEDEEMLALTEDEIDRLTTIVAQCEQSTDVLTMEDAWLMTLLPEIEVEEIVMNVL